MIKKLILLCFIFLLGSANAAIVVEKLDIRRKIATIKVVEKIKYEEEYILKRELDALEAEGYKLKMNAIQLNTIGKRYL